MTILTHTFTAKRYKTLVNLTFHAISTCMFTGRPNNALRANHPYI